MNVRIPYHFSLLGQPHEGSGYASAKVLQMAWHRLEHARSRVKELERIKNEHILDRTSLMRQQLTQAPQLQQQIVKTEPSYK